MRKTVSSDMTSGDLRRQIITFAFPIFLGNLFQLFYNTADSFIVGNYVGAEALAAVSSTSALISILGVLISEPIMKLMNTPSDILNDAVTYLSIYFAGAVGLIMYNMFVSTLQASGDSRNPLYYLIISSLLNIVLDIVFIRNFHLGVAGAAYATVLTQIISALQAMANLMHRKDSIHLSLRKIRFDQEILTQMIRFSGIGFSMSGAKEEVRKSADYITDSVSEAIEILRNR